MHGGQMTAAVLLLGLSFPLLAGGKGSPIRTPKTFQSKLASAERKLLSKHLKLAKKLKRKKHPWESYSELLWAQRLDPDHRQVVRLLPKVEPPKPRQTAELYKTERTDIDALAMKELGGLLDRGQRGELTAEVLGAAARQLLHYHPNHRLARKVMGFRGKRGRWVTARERRIQQSYAQAWKKVAEPKPLKVSPVPKLEKALGLELTFRESRHAYVAMVAKDPDPQALITMGKAADVAYAAIHHDMFGTPGVYQVPGARPATGAKVKPLPKLLLLMFDDREQHLRYLEVAVNDPNLKVAGKNLTFVSTWWKPEKVLVCDNWSRGRHLKEWPAQRMALYAFAVRFGRGRPTYLIQGLARYYSAHTSGQALIRTVPTGSAVRSDQRRMRAGDYAQLRSLARWALNNFRAPLPADQGLRKRIDGMNRADNAVATAFVDYLLAERPANLLKLLIEANPKKTPLEKAFQTAFGQEPSAVDDAFAAWFADNY